MQEENHNILFHFHNKIKSNQQKLFFSQKKKKTGNRNVKQINMRSLKLKQQIIVQQCIALVRELQCAHKANVFHICAPSTNLPSGVNVLLPQA